MEGLGEMDRFSGPVTQPQVEFGCHELPGKVARGGGGKAFD